MTELERNKIAGLVDGLFRAIENDPQGPANDLDHLVWITLSLTAYLAAQWKDRQASAAVHARAAAASLRKYHAALMVIDEEAHRHHTAPESLVARIDACDEEAVSAERNAIFAQVVGARLADGLSRSGIPDQFLRSNGRHRPRDIVLDLLIAEEAVRFGSEEGRPAPLPTATTGAEGKYHGEFFERVIARLPSAAARYGIQLDEGAHSSAIASRIKRILASLRALELSVRFTIP
jgi:hypothetical protein